LLVWKCLLYLLPHWHLLTKFSFGIYGIYSRWSCPSNNQFYPLLEHEHSEQYFTSDLLVLCTISYQWEALTPPHLKCWYGSPMDEETCSRFMILITLSIGKCIFACYLLTLVLRSRIFLPWRWRRYDPPKRRFNRLLLHGATPQKTAFFIVTAVKTSNLTKWNYSSTWPKTHETSRKPHELEWKNVIFCRKLTKEWSWNLWLHFLNNFHRELNLKRKSSLVSLNPW
jgi:hypothetical protein